jgi:hypothetical protein
MEHQHKPMQMGAVAADDPRIKWRSQRAAVRRPPALAPIERRLGALCDQRRGDRLHARRKSAAEVIDRLAGHALRDFRSHEDWTGHLRALGLTDLRVTPDPVRVASSAAALHPPGGAE